MNKINKILFTLIILIFSVNISFAENLKIWTIERKPFVIQENNKLNWFSIELWDEIATKLNLKYEFQKYEIFWNMLKSVENKDIDLAIANISITSSREKIMDFSHPIFDSWIVLMVKRQDEYNLLNFLKSKIFINIIISFITILFLILIFSKIKNSKFKKVSNILFIVSFFVFTAIIFSNYTLEKINYKNLFNYSLENLNNKKIWVIKSSTAEKLLKENNIKYISFEKINDLFSEINLNKLDWVMHDEPVLKYYIKNNTKFELIWKVYKKEKFWILFPEKSDLKEKINLTILELKSNWKYEKIYNKYFWEY